MTAYLVVSQTVALSHEDRALLRAEARGRNVGNGLLARALLRYGLSRLDEADLVELIEQEANEEKARISAAARANVMQRWRNADNEDGEDR